MLVKRAVAALKSNYKLATIRPVVNHQFNLRHYSSKSEQKELKMTPPPSEANAVNDAETKHKLPITPFSTYQQAREVPQKIIGVEAAFKAAEDPSFEVKPGFPSEFSLENKACIVTGGNSGIGLEYATMLAELGGSVYSFDIKDEASEDFLKCKSYIKRMPGGKGSLEYVKADVTNGEQLQKAVSDVAEKHDGLHVMVANAGILGPVVDCDEYPADWFRRIMEVNVTGVFLSIQTASQEMLKRNIKGSIICTASMSGSIINKDMHWVPYTTSKAAVIQLAKGFACELGTTGIRVNTISPGHIRTRMTEAYLGVEPLIENCWAAQNPMGRLGAVHELRGTIAYLATDASTYTTGIDLQVCGGHTAW
ncbi:hypothetical protein TRVA0_029S00584 [Trichomonascus vanleenenianus]|uniref:uncharacterized protein n=1 Tax=Trichomonascus vanleenenianus TaxID=2268995 RepID=UPI003EC96960